MKFLVSLKRFCVRVLAIIGLLTLIIIIVIGGIITTTHKPVPELVILEMDLEKPLVEYVPDDPLAQVALREATTVLDVVEALEQARSDDRVLGLVAKVGAVPMGLATIQEIRDAVRRFAGKDKFTVAYAESFGEFGPGNGAYYLATAFDEIYLQPSGDVGLTGLMYESPFVRGTLDKLHVEPRIDQREEFKNAKNMFTETEYTEAHREAVEALMNSHFRQIVRGISKARGISEEEVTRLADGGPVSGHEAVEANLVDKLLYRDQVYEKVKSKAQAAELLYLEEYLRCAGRPHKKGPVIALIYGVGGVHRGKSEYNFLSQSPSMGSDTVAAAFREAVADESVNAILFRVNSPGGSYVASDTIWREADNARQAGKPVIVSMGDVAGSGGYFVAMSANKIVAQPGTITGSIGVVAGKFLTRQFWQEHLGVSWDEVHTSNNATMWASTHDYSPQQWEKLQEFLDRAYEDFTTKAAQGRGLEKEKMMELAKGRIWGGEDARKLGLVDELGGYDVALRLARTEAGLMPDQEITLKVFPRPRNPLEQLLKVQPQSSEPQAATVAMRQVQETFGPVYDFAKQTGLLEETDVLTMPSLKTNW
jgi:protease-4